MIAPYNPEELVVRILVSSLDWDEDSGGPIPVGLGPPMIAALKCAAGVSPLAPQLSGNRNELCAEWMVSGNHLAIDVDENYDSGLYAYYRHRNSEQIDDHGHGLEGCAILIERYLPLLEDIVMISREGKTK